MSEEVNWRDLTFGDRFTMTISGEVFPAAGTSFPLCVLFDGAAISDVTHFAAAELDAATFTREEKALAVGDVVRGWGLRTKGAIAVIHGMYAYCEREDGQLNDPIPLSDLTRVQS